MTDKRLINLLYNSVITLVLTSLITSCASVSNQGTIAELDTVKIELKDADIDVKGGLEKAMAGYQKFLEETPESELTPEAIRRLADLKVEKEYGVLGDGEIQEREVESQPAAVAPVPDVSTKAISAIDGSSSKSTGAPPPLLAAGESEKDFEKRATQQGQIASQQGPLQMPKGEAGADLKNKGAEEAIRLYSKLLEKYPQYERNDQVLYQLSRAYEETGQVDEAMVVMNRLVKQFPNSRYTDEVQFRRGEYYFTRKKYLDAEDAYGEALKFGVGSVYYERALYKKGWTFYKQELYEEALDQFFLLLDHKVSIGYDFEQTTDDIEKKRINDTFRVVSLSFSNQGGADTIKEYFGRKGTRPYEDFVYSQLAEFYFDKRRYNDAAVTYNNFIDSNPFHKKSPHFSMRVIDIYFKGGFPRLVIESKKRFASTYGLDAEYWNYFNQSEYPEVLGYLKTNITDLANHYHSLYQNKKFVKDKATNFAEASHWYREFLKSFPADEQSPGINYQLADLYLENQDFRLAAIEYERSAYDYPVNDKSQKAAYAAVFAYREHLKKAPNSQIGSVKREIIRSSIRLVDTFPKHEKATLVLGAAVDDLYNMRDFPLAIKMGRRLIEEYPRADAKTRRSAWLVVAHSSYEIELYRDAELGYIEVLKLTSQTDTSRVKLVDNLAASIYKQGEQARNEERYREAVRHFLRIAKLAPTSKIRPSAEYDAAAVLIQIVDLEQAATVLLGFRQNYPGHDLQKDVTKKIAFVYQEMGKFGVAAKEYERVAAEAGDEEDLIREAMLTAAELYEKDKDTENSLRVYKKFVVKFPKPLEFALETYYKIAMIYKSRNELMPYRNTLQHIIDSDAKAGPERTDRTRYLAAQSSLVIIEPSFDEFIAIKLIKPFKVSLTKKQKSMKALVKRYTDLVDYQVADVTAASTYYVAEIYYNFSRSLLGSERPDGLSEVELEEFTLMLEEQAFPFEEKAIGVHEKNVQLLTAGIYSSWVDRSISKLAKLLPARYAKPEESTNYITKIDNYNYSSPRYQREDAHTGFITKLDFFRYVSQKHQQAHHKNKPNADISTQEQKVLSPKPSVSAPAQAEGGTAQPGNAAVPSTQTVEKPPVSTGGQAGTGDVKSQETAGSANTAAQPSEEETAVADTPSTTSGVQPVDAGQASDTSEQQENAVENSVTGTEQQVPAAAGEGTQPAAVEAPSTVAGEQPAASEAANTETQAQDSGTGSDVVDSEPAAPAETAESAEPVSGETPSTVSAEQPAVTDETSTVQETENSTGSEPEVKSAETQVTPDANQNAASGETPGSSGAEETVLSGDEVTEPAPEQVQVESPEPGTDTQAQTSDSGGDTASTTEESTADGLVSGTENVKQNVIESEQGKVTEKQSVTSPSESPKTDSADAQGVVDSQVDSAPEPAAE